MRQATIVLGDLVIGAEPRVVGTIASAPGMAELAAATPVAGDIVELRLDDPGVYAADWAGCAAALGGRGIPVLATIRMQAERGGWTAPETERRELFGQAVELCAAVDIELASALAPEIVAMATAAGRAVVVSHHDFSATPPLAELKAIVARAVACGPVIVKIATMFRGEEDVCTLRDLLAEDWPVPLCAMGMGAIGSRTRVDLAAAGSAMVYGYLDAPAAPGQPSAAELAAALGTSGQRSP